MNEKAFKTMTMAGVSNIVIGIIIAVIGVAAGVMSIVSGARLIKDKKGLTFWVIKAGKEFASLGKYYLYSMSDLLYGF